MLLSTKFQLIRRISDFGTKFAQNASQGGVLGQTQPENNLFEVKNTIMLLVLGGFR